MSKAKGAPGWYKVKTDQANSAGNYPYAEIDTEAKKSTIRTQLKNNILDGVYETNAHDFKNRGKLGFIELSKIWGPLLIFVNKHMLCYWGGYNFGL